MRLFRAFPEGRMKDLLREYYMYLLASLRGVGVRRIPLGFEVSFRNPFTGDRERVTYRVSDRRRLGALATTIREIFGEKTFTRFSLPWPGARVLDGGANVGVYTVYAAALGAKVVAVEPEPQNYKDLVRNVRENELEDLVTPMNAALWSESSTLYLEITESGTLDRVYLESGANRVPVKAIAADELGNFDIVKLDVEGAEVNALRGMTRGLARVWAVMLETHIVNGRDTFSAVAKLLGDAGMRIRRFGNILYAFRRFRSL